MVSHSSRAFPDLLVHLMTLVYMGFAPFGGCEEWKERRAVSAATIVF